MKLLIVVAICTSLATFSGAQTTHAKAPHNRAQAPHAQPSLESLPQTTLNFQPVGGALGVSAGTTVDSSPFCSADGTLYFTAEILPSHDEQIVAVSPKGKLSSHSLTSVPGLTIAYTKGTDAVGPNIYAWVVGEKTEILLSHDVSTTKDSWQARYFLVRFRGQLSAPDIIPLELPFEPIQFAALDDHTFVFLGLDQIHLSPVLAVVNGSGQLDHYIDAYYAFPKSESIAANAPWRAGGGNAKLPLPEGLRAALYQAQFVHSRSSLLLLIAGFKPKVFTIRSDGGFESTTLRLPAGFAADALITSDNKWLVRATDYQPDQEHLFLVDPATGKALRTIQSRKRYPVRIACIHGGSYYGLHWTDPEGNKPIFLVKATP